MLSIKFVVRLARHLLRDFRSSFTKYAWNDWEITQFEGEKFLSWSFGNSSEDIRMSVDISLPPDWQKVDELRFAKVLSVLTLA